MKHDGICWQKWMVVMFANSLHRKVNSNGLLCQSSQSHIILVVPYHITVICMHLHGKKCFIKMMTCRLLQFQGSLNRWVVCLKKSKTQSSSIMSLTFPSSFKELASTDTCLLTNICQFIRIHLVAIVQFRIADNCQQMEVYELVYVG